MTRKMLIVLACLVIGSGIAALLYAAPPVPLDTVQKGFTVIRAEADEDTALAVATAGNFAGKPTTAFQLLSDDYGLVSGINGGEIVFCGGDAANDTFTYKIYLYRKPNGMARLAATGTGTLGTQQVVIYPQGGAATTKFWADTLTVTDTWISTAASSDTVGSNGVASIVMDFAGYAWLYVEITNADGTTGIEAGDITAYISWY